MLSFVAGILAAMEYSGMGSRSISGISASLGFGNLTDDGVRLVLAVPTTMLLAAAAAIGYRNKHRLQSVRDASAGGTRSYLLYLRPYYTDRRLALLNPYYSAMSGGLGLDPAALHPEEFVGAVLEPYIDVRQFGGESTIGNARIHVSNERWQEAVRAAVDNASAIVVIPFLHRDRRAGAPHGEATLWELRYLVTSGAMAWTIVLMPAVYWSIRRRTREAWERARMRTVGFGLELPPYEERGCALTFAAQNGVWRAVARFAPSTTFRKASAAGLVEALRWVAEQRGFPLLDR